VSDPYFAVSELFYSIQGESTWAGLPCVFVRLAGCNLRCRYCDASYTWQEEGRRMRLADIEQWLAGFPGIMAEVTGGEPLLQDGVHTLLARMVAGGRRVLLETNGSVSLAGIPDAVHVILDIKCPGSGMDHLTDWDNIALIRQRNRDQPRDQLKFVLTSAADFYWAGEVIGRYGLIDAVPVLMSPVQPDLPPQKLAELILGERLNVRLQMQLHRILWPDRHRGA
jgi:7-carboxy-7-deazaguanine synthase